MKGLGYLFSTIVAMVGGGVIYGFTLTHLWAWFIVTTFHLPPLRIVQAIGLGIVVSLMTKEHPDSREKMSFGTTLIVNSIQIVAINGISLLTGYCWSKFL